MAKTPPQSVTSKSCLILLRTPCPVPRKARALRSCDRQASSTIRMSVLVLLVRRTLSRDQSCAGFAKQKQESALRFRDSAHSNGEMRDRTLRNARENRQNDMSLNFSENPTVCFFRSGVGRTVVFAIPFVLMRWRARQDSNLRPPCLEAMQYKTLSAAAGVAYEEARHLSRP